MIVKTKRKMVIKAEKIEFLLFGNRICIPNHLIVKQASGGKKYTLDIRLGRLKNLIKELLHHHC